MAWSDLPGNRPLRIMAVVEWYPPAFRAGGPIRSVHNLMRLLKAQTPHHLHVVCGPRDLGSPELLPGVTVDKPVDRDGVKVIYVSDTSLSAWKARLKGTPEAPSPDVLYLNSLFSVPFALRPLWVARRQGIRVVLAPRGMLGAGALAIKPLKKKVFLTAARVLGWFRDVRWHASTEVEATEVRAHFPKAELAEALNVPLAPVECQNPEWGTEVVWVAVGRIQSKKNLHFALEALQEVRLEEKTLTVELVGPAEDEAYLKRLLGMARPGLKVVHRGPVPPEELGEVWGRAHALLMPTTHENFGHAVVEAWAHGRPVLLSDQTPWRGLAAAGLGWDLPLDHSVWVKEMEEALEWDSAVWKEMSEACRARHLSLVQDPELVQANRAVFEG
ncbi:MAG: glycosyltransferase [Flavobacteriales bacterium]